MLISHGLALAHLLQVLKVQPVEFALMDYRISFWRWGAYIPGWLSFLFDVGILGGRCIRGVGG